ncbi:MAG: S53 family peptidase [Nitrospirae bacterium]|nr:S53 family peptidase [Nitrospirota bacterium]
MRNRFFFLMTVLVLAVVNLVPGFEPSAQADDNQDSRGISQAITPNSNDSIHVPDSTQENPAEIGTHAHTNHLLLLRNGAASAAVPSGYGPVDIRTAYGLPSTGGQGTIAIVDAFDYPTAESDLNVFSSQYGLPACTTANGCFTKLYASGAKPKANCGWAQETALDIEWAHAMAPNAKILLVEAASNSLTNLFNAVNAATNYSLDVTEESNSWGSSEFSSEVNYDAYFYSRPGIVYFAASGDSGGKTIYPAASPYVIAAGGTSLHSINPVNETAWSGSGGGRSLYESRLFYQDGISNLTGTARGVPDFSAVADPATGVSVYDSTSCRGMSGWMVFGGTSVASPVLAGIVNLANHVVSTTTTVSELATLYSPAAIAGTATDFRDIISGTAGGFSAQAGWDFITGVGSNIGLNGK